MGIRKGKYVGVTGFMDLWEVMQCYKAFLSSHVSHDKDLPQLLMAGILVSSKTLAGGINKWPGRYPKMSAVPALLECCNYPYILNTIHYNTDDLSSLEEQVGEIIDIGKGRIHAIQLNSAWPHHMVLQRIKRRWPDLRIILQIGTPALAEVTERSERHWVTYLKDAVQGYKGFVDDVLVDGSGGRGLELDVNLTLHYLEDLLPSGVSCGYAGGIRPENADRLLSPIMRRHGFLSVDTEGGVRTPQEEGDKMIVDRATRYIEEVFKVASLAQL